MVVIMLERTEVIAREEAYVEKAAVSFLTALILLVSLSMQPVLASTIQVFGEEEPGSGIDRTASQGNDQPSNSAQKAGAPASRGQRLQPPELYAEAAILMDMDTGQVIYGKNPHQRMYPASLTKVITCLLAIEEGNFSDKVTITAEMIDTVPRSSTHIALTYGEELTLGQLVNAMMVESANDAANAVAVHLGGSLPGFVEMMNRKADELGADGTHFSNPNGLPEDDHYTTAYDLALFTREALAHEEFRTLAGTQHYEIPPTNLQPQTRRMNNRQYMFCLNDTYPGAFAGKTGWTEEAGNTLITIAERDNVTLTSVVLKSNGVADAEFIDSTNLLDYGYDNFHRVFVPKDGVEDRKVDGGTLVAQEMPVLLPDLLSVDQLNLQVNTESPGQEAVTVLAPKSVSAFMEPQVGYFPFLLVPDDLPVSAEGSDPESQRAAVWSHIKWERLVRSPVAWIAGGVLFFLLAVALLVRGISRMRYRRRQRRMRDQRIRGPIQEPPTGTVRVYRPKERMGGPKKRR